MTDTAGAASPVPAAATVNGPEGEDLDRASVDWRRVEDVRRLRQRISTASQAGDLKKVRNLQKLMLRSRSNTLLSVRRVTEINAGRATAGVDGKVVLMSQSKAALADWVSAPIRSKCRDHAGSRPVCSVGWPARVTESARRHSFC